MTHCIECGAKIEKDDTFCPECGAKVIRKEEKKKKKKKKSEEPSLARNIVSVLAVLMLVSAVIYFAVLMAFTNKTYREANPQQPGPRVEENRCDLTGDYSCLHGTFHENAVVLTLRHNGFGLSTLEHISIEGCPGKDLDLTLGQGEKEAIIVECTPASLAQYLERDFFILYQSSKGAPSKAEGEITGIVQMGLRAAEQ